MSLKDKKNKKNKKDKSVENNLTVNAKSLSIAEAVNRRIYHMVRDGAVGEYLSGYDKTCERYKDTWFYHKLQWLKKKITLRKTEEAQQEKKPDGMENVGMYDEETLPRSFKDSFASAFDNSRIIQWVRAFKEHFLYTPLVTYGVMVFGFALFMLMSQTLTLFLSVIRSPFAMLSHFSGDDNILVITYMVIAVVFMTISLPLMFTKKGSFFTSLNESRFGSFFLRHFSGIRSESISKKIMPSHNGKAFVCGVFFGLLTFFVPPWTILAFFAVMIFVAIVMNIPEFGLEFLIFVLPFLSLMDHPTYAAVAISLLVLCSLFLKVLRGKRSIRFEPTDLYVLLFMVLILFGGVFTYGGLSSFCSAMVFVVLGSMYFAVTVLIKNEEWLKRFLSAFMASSCIVSIVGIAEWVLNKQSKLWQDNEVFSTLAGRVVSYWRNPNVLAGYLLVAFFISFGCMIGRKNKRIKFLSFMAFVLSAVCLILTWSRGAWLSVALVFVVTLLILSYKTIPWVMILVAGGIAVFFFLPDTFVERVSSIVTVEDSSVLYRINIWKGCAALIRSCFFTGVGVGDAAFAECYGDFALSGIESAPHAHNLFLQITIELGIAGLIVFVMVLLMLVRSSFSHFRKRSFRHFSSISGLACLAALMALLVNGMTEYVWYDNRIYLLFWLVAGLVTAIRRIGMNKLEELQQEPYAYDWRATLARGKKLTK